MAGTADVVRDLKAANVPLYLLTNMPVDVYDARRARFPVLQEFDGAVVSGVEGVLKPDAEIFRRLVERYRLEPPETLFVDDVEKNVEGARRAGLLGHRFVDAATLRAELDRLGLLPS